MNDSPANKSVSSLRSKLLLPLLAVSFCLVLLTILGIRFFIDREVESQIRRRAESLAASVTYVAENIDGTPELQRVVCAIAADSDVNLIIVMAGKQPRVIACNQHKWLGKSLSELPEKHVAEDLALTLQRRESLSRWHRETAEYDYTPYVRLTLPDVADLVPTEGAIMIHIDTRSIHAQVVQSVIGLWSTAAISLISLTLLAYWLIDRHVLSPLRKIGSQLQLASVGPATIDSGRSKNDEIGLLVTKLNDSLRGLWSRENQLRESESRLRLLLDSLPNHVWMADTQGRLEFVSQQMAEYLGPAAEELIVRGWQRFLHPEDAARTELMRDEALSLGKSRSFDFRLRRADGEYRWLMGQILPMKDKHGSISKWFGIHTDVTERKEIELHEHTQRQIASLRIDFQNELTRSNVDLGATMRACCQTLSQHLEDSSARIWLRQTSEDPLELAASSLNDNIWLIQDVQALTELQVQRIVREGAAISISTPSQTTSTADFPRAALPRTATYFAGFPLVVDGNVIGVLAIVSTRALSTEVQDCVLGLAGTLAQGLQRQRAELLLQENEFRKTAIVNNALDCIISMDHLGRIVDFNPAAERTFGYAKDQVLGQRMVDLIVPHHLRAAHEAGLQRYLQSRQSRLLGQRIELDGMRSTGEIFPIELAITTMQSKGPSLFTAYLRDITDRKQNELWTSIQHAVSLALVDAASVRQAVSDTLQTICQRLHWDFGDLFLLDPDDNRLICLEYWASPTLKLENFAEKTASLRLTTGEGLPGRVWANRQPQWIHDIQAQSDFIRAPQAGQVGLTSAMAFPVLVDGAITGVMEFFSQSPREADEKFAELLGQLGSQIGQFIRRKQAEEALIQINQQLEQRIQQRTNELEAINMRLLKQIARVNLLADIGLHMSAANEMRNMLQLCVDEMAKHCQKTSLQLWTHLSPSDDRMQLQALSIQADVGTEAHFSIPVDTPMLGDVLRERRNKSLQPEKNIRDIPGFEWLGNHYHSFVGFPLLVQDRVFGVLAAFAESPLGDEELSMLSQAAPVIALGLERRHAELLTRQARDEATRANQAKSEFLANMSHEVRTPVSAMMGHADMLLDPRLPECERARSVQTIRRNGQYLLQIINDILDISKIEAGQLQLTTHPCSPWELIQDAALTCQFRAQEKNLKLTIAASGRVPRTCSLDPVRVRQILLNFVSNSIKFTDPGRGIQMCLSAEPSPPRLRFTVVDEGIGISQADMHLLFEPFKQIDNSSTRKHGGTGLGLSISKRLSHAMGGEIQVQSTVGKGSEFTLLIPLTDAGSIDWIDASQLEKSLSAGVSPVEVSLRPAWKARILLAEDNADIQAIMLYHLRAAGLDIATATNGREVVERALNENFDLILMDIQMPEMDGYSATQTLRSRGYVAPIIALTAHAMRGDREKILSSGLNDYLVKPVDAGILINTIAKHLIGKAATEKTSETMSQHADPPTIPPEAQSNPPASTTAESAPAKTFAQLTTKFKQSLPVTLQSIQQAAAQSDWPLVSSLAHQITGAAGFYGLPVLSETAGLIETAIRERQAESLIQDLLQELAKEIEHIEIA